MHNIQKQWYLAFLKTPQDNVPYVVLAKQPISSSVACQLLPHRNFECSHGDIKTWLSHFASLNSSFVLHGDLNHLFKLEYDSLYFGVPALQERIVGLTIELSTIKAKLAGVILEHEQLARFEEGVPPVITYDDLL
ncbi:hypothetical protein PIB30_056189 [Stylosanthes scabra]|uniref:Uncharacterized protein n=1 Tax=Stylosanthes scabra TaxID=79078 RepID=A0ABU6UIT1_9FABA|nr:hypothetical protein [Stylosanthes scabra]